MGAARQTRISETVATELTIVEQFLAIARQFQAAIGAAGARHTWDAATLAEEDAGLAALADQAQILHEELASVHRAYQAEVAATAAPAESGEIVSGSATVPPAHRLTSRCLAPPRSPDH